MSNQQTTQFKLPDAAEATKTMWKVAEQTQRILQNFLYRQTTGKDDDFTIVDPVVVARAFQELTRETMGNPKAVIQTCTSMQRDYLSLWHITAQRLLGQETEPLVKPEPSDKRFNDELWNDNVAFDYIKQSYLITARYLKSCVSDVEGLDKNTAKKIDFYTRQFVDTMAPTNFVLTNPKVLRKTLETGGENLLIGLSNMLDDLERGKGRLRVKMTKLNSFELGKNIAVTPGNVVYQNDLIQLIQYAPTTDTVYQHPLLIIPPWINKYYILDLRPKNSFIKWALDQGHTVFVISWVNPDQSLAEKTFEDYMNEGALSAMDAIEQATGEQHIKAIGYCLGGTLLASTLAYLAEMHDSRIKAATFFVTLVDFAEAGELSVFIDRVQLALMEEHMTRKGYLEGEHMQDAFNLLRANDLIWSFVVNNYLMGQEPFPFDLLYWNSDSTRMPKAMHSFYLREFYLNNRLSTSRGITLNGVSIDLGKIDTPAYLLATREDHIAPWQSTYVATQLYSGPIRFVLGASGHIAGVINPPSSKKYGYWTNSKLPEDPEDWFNGAKYQESSWWLDWKNWIRKYNGKKVPARQPGCGKLDIIEEAPGTYVRVRTADG